jgi:hypothetical protein
MAVTRQWLSSNHVGIPTERNATKEQCFLRGPVPCYKQDRWSNEFVVRQSPADKKVNTKEEDIIRIRQKATTNKDTADCA